MRRAPPGRWPPCPSWTGASSTTCTGPAVRYANIDHVVVGPGGVFVIDSKAWSGSVAVVDGMLRQNGTDANGTSWPPLDAALAVAELVPGLDPTAVKPLLCFDREEPVFGWSHEVMVCSTINVATLLTSRPVVLDGATLRATAETLAQSLKAATDPIAPVPPKRQLPKKGRGASPTKTAEPGTVRCLDPGCRPVRLSRPRDGPPGSPLSSRTRPAPDRSGFRPRRDRDRGGQPGPAQAAAHRSTGCAPRERWVPRLMPGLTPGRESGPRYS